MEEGEGRRERGRVFGGKKNSDKLDKARTGGQLRRRQMLMSSLPPANG